MVARLSEHHLFQRMIWVFRFLARIPRQVIHMFCCIPLLSHHLPSWPILKTRRLYRWGNMNRQDQNDKKAPLLKNGYAPYKSCWWVHLSMIWQMAKPWFRSLLPLKQAHTCKNVAHMHTFFCAWTSILFPSAFTLTVSLANSCTSKLNLNLSLSCPMNFSIAESSSLISWPDALSTKMCTIWIITFYEIWKQKWIPICQSAFPKTAQWIIVSINIQL